MWHQSKAMGNTAFWAIFDQAVMRYNAKGKVIIKNIRRDNSPNLTNKNKKI